MRIPPFLRTLALRFLVAAVVATAAMGLFITAINVRLDAKLDSIQREDVVLDTTPREAKAGNYLIVGSDSREFAEDESDIESFGDAVEVGGERADAIMIAHVDPEVEEVFVVSIPRDTVVTLPDGSRSKIADVWGRDGAQALVDVIGTNFDVPITHYLAIDFDGFRRIVDLVGPIEIYFRAPARDEKTGLSVEQSGCVELDGDQALAFVRSRYFEENIFGEWQTDPTSDFGRIKRQQAFLRQIAVRARDEAYGSSSPFAIENIVDAAIAPLRADHAFGRDEILGLVQRFRDIDPYDPAVLEMITLPVVNGPAGTGLGAIQVLDQPAADEVFARLRTFGPQPEPDPGVVPEPGDPTTTTTVAPDPDAPGWPDPETQRC